MVDHGRLLGGHDRVDGWNVRGREHRRVFGRSADARRPAEALEAGAVEVGDAAEAAPAPDRHESLELHLVRQLRQPHRIRPSHFQCAGHRGDGAAAAEIGAERAELELAVVEKRISRAAKLLHLGARGGHFHPPCFRGRAIMWRPRSSTAGPCALPLKFRSRRSGGLQYRTGAGEMIRRPAEPSIDRQMADDQLRHQEYRDKGPWQRSHGRGAGGSKNSCSGEPGAEVSRGWPRRQGRAVQSYSRAGPASECRRRGSTAPRQQAPPWHRR